jgi:hypothetical protein
LSLLFLSVFLSVLSVSSSLLTRLKLRRRPRAHVISERLNLNVTQLELIKIGLSELPEAHEGERDHAEPGELRREEPGAERRLSAGLGAAALGGDLTSDLKEL